MGDGGDASEYSPIMVSLAQEQTSVLRVVRNSHVDPDNPALLVTFVQVSDTSFLFLRTPEGSPDWVIPRMLVAAFCTPSTGAATTIVSHPYVLGYRQRDPAGLRDERRVEFVRLPAASPAF
ncbi:putative calpain-like cysteine peptidase putative cysteine peptidase Clan CA family C2 [Leptomonas seymouri]|uniref:Putative calpain-like cysteine peptidase putative cysteine peptidase Clan CA family C2 n=1 Tax=Leptomonas seymouri TaxID=5684 RepID=A0A0N0P6Y0_LEPSE|nr:putative calpain-like cysteine peptidase putative cysteine peptidase Clan CA family C2 [Leptomonas seymouri]|eukprot:KPI88156.1 putative calpain-like cysteine peptidase putative cysteine peptidase Clan CA family C2 [Leptomonas seymouri]